MSFAAGLRRRPLLARALAVASGAVIGQVIILVGSFVLARWFFEPEDFGILAALVGTSTVLALLSTMRLELAIQLPDCDTDAAAVRSAALRAAGTCSVLTVGVGAALARSGVLRLGDSVVLMLLLGPLVFVTAWFNVEGFWAIRRGHFGHVARARALLGLATVVPQLIAGVVGMGGIGLVIGPLVGYGAASASFVASRGALGSESLRGRTSRRGTVSVLAEYRRFPMLSLPSAFFNRGAIEVSSLLLLALFGPAAAGVYFLCRRALLTPVNVINDSIYQSFLNRASSLARTDAGALGDLTRTTIRNLALAVVAPTAVAMVVVPWLLPAAFGPSWAEAGALSIFVLPYAAVTAVVIPVSSLTWVLERQDLELVRNVGRFVAVVATFGIAALIDASLTMTVGLYCGVLAAADVGLVFIIIHLVRINERDAERSNCSEVTAHG